MRILLTIVLIGIVSCFQSAAQEVTIRSSQSPIMPAQATTSHRIVVISDLHMGEGKNPKTGLWYPMEDFRWPKQFTSFIEQLDREGHGDTILIGAGDVLELWQSQLQDCRRGRDKDLGCTEQEAEQRAQRVLSAHREELLALGKFARSGSNKIIIIPGNHDAALLFPRVRQALFRAIDGGERVQFAPSGYWNSADGAIYVEHGHQIGQEVNKWDSWPSPFIKKKGKAYLQRPWGEQFVQDYYNRFETQYPIIDNISSQQEGVRYAMAGEGPTQTIGDIAGFFKFYLFGVSWEQFKGNLGRGEDASTPQWDIKAIRSEGPQFLLESLPADHPFLTALEHSPQTLLHKQEAAVFDALTDQDIKRICDQRALEFQQQASIPDGRRTTIKMCPSTEENLGALVQSITRSNEEVLAQRIEQSACPALKNCAKQHTLLFIYGHTHSAFAPRELSLSEGYFKPIVVNSGAWQRVATAVQVESLRTLRHLPKDATLPKLLPEDLPACYSYVTIEPYATGQSPLPVLRYWVGSEGELGESRKECGS